MCVNVNISKYIANKAIASLNALALSRHFRNNNSMSIQLMSLTNLIYQNGGTITCAQIQLRKTFSSSYNNRKTNK